MKQAESAVVISRGYWRHRVWVNEWSAGYGQAGELFAVVLAGIHGERGVAAVRVHQFAPQQSVGMRE